MPVNNIDREVGTIKRQAIPLGAQHGKTEQTCRVCGCTNYDCRQCIEKIGEACWWIEPDLCSACASKTIDAFKVKCRKCQKVFKIFRAGLTLVIMIEGVLRPAVCNNCEGRILDKV